MSAVNLKEADVEKVVIDTLRMNGFTVWKLGGQRPLQRVFMAVSAYLRGTGFHLDEKKSAGLRRTISTAFEGSSENDKSAPDLILRHKSWPQWCLMGLEVKGPTTTIDPGQQVESDKGGYPICRGVKECLEAVMKMDNKMSPDDAVTAGRRETNLFLVAQLY